MLFKRKIKETTNDLSETLFCCTIVYCRLLNCGAPSFKKKNVCLRNGQVAPNYFEPFFCAFVRPLLQMAFFAEIHSLFSLVGYDFPYIIIIIIIISVMHIGYCPQCLASPA
uniref:Uncharacterized protein n=1 Tax=Trypanosoma vivax (strain Y486) TaxID=1055687 RepID=G0TVH1_TRYVY|nr:hypothetical protein, unlikely [Trypanosoma vivax Y486]